jgi:hypothetical protein
MLPGFRFLFAAILSSMSILVFGLGAAALLRAAHKEVANIPSRWAPPEPVFAQQNEPAPPTLALLRVEPPVADQPADPVAAADTPAEQVPAEAPDAAPPVEPEKLAALKQDDEAPAKPETTTEETTAVETTSAEITPAEATPAAEAQADQTSAVAPADEAKLAAVADISPPAAVAAPAAPEPEQASAPAAPETSLAAPETSLAATKIATLGGPAVPIKETASGKASGKASEAKPDRSAIRKRVAERVKQRRRTAQRAPQVIVQQPANPFVELTTTPATR